MAGITRLPARDMTERQLQQSVIDLCKIYHLLCYHTRNSQGSAAGFPDLTIVGPHGILFAELKSAHGKTTIEQRCWESGILEAGGVFVLWRPEHWHSGEIRETLAALCARAPERPAASPRRRIYTLASPRGPMGGGGRG